VPVLDEADLSLPLAVGALLGVAGMEAQRDRLVAGREGATADGVRGFALVIGEVDAKLVGEKIASEDGVGASVDETV
jgi:hypothetical protein